MIRKNRKSSPGGLQTTERTLDKMVPPNPSEKEFAVILNENASA